jgi:hypothetical protein
MILRPTPLPVTARLSAAALPAAALMALAAPLAAQETPGSFELPPASPSPTPAPAGPADERGGVAIPPRAVPTAPPSVDAAPSATPLPDRAPIALPPPPVRESAPPARAGAPSAPAPALAPPAATPEATQPPGAPAPAPSDPAPPFTSAPADAGRAAAAPENAFPPSALPDWWPFAAGGLGALALLGGAALAWRRRKARPLRLAAPAAAAERESAAAPPAADLPRLDLTLEITAATRSLMMFTLEYRLAIANRSERAVNDLALALQLACARASGAGNAPSAGSAQALQSIARIGPHQARSITGTVQLPLSAIAPLRQGTTPLFVPLVHVTLEGEGQRPLARSFVVGTPSASGRVHPIPLDVPPGALAGLVAQAIALPPASAAA